MDERNCKHGTARHIRFLCKSSNVMPSPIGYYPPGEVIAELSGPIIQEIDSILRANIATSSIESLELLLKTLIKDQEGVEPPHHHQFSSEEPPCYEASLQNDNLCVGSSSSRLELTFPAKRTSTRPSILPVVPLLPNSS